MFISNRFTIFYENSFFNVPSKIIGVVIMTSFKWNNEVATLSLAASVGEIFREFLEQKNGSIKSFPRPLLSSQHKCKYICYTIVYLNQMNNNDINLCTI